MTRKSLRRRLWRLLLVFDEFHTKFFIIIFRRSQKNGTNVEEKSNVERRRGTGKTRFLHSAAADIDPFRLSLHRSKSDIIKIFWNLLFVDFRKRPVETRSSKAVHFKLCFYAEVFRRVFSDRARWHTQERAKRSLYENLILRIHYLGLWTPIFLTHKKDNSCSFWPTVSTMRTMISNGKK